MSADLMTEMQSRGGDEWIGAKSDVGKGQKLGLRSLDRGRLGVPNDKARGKGCRLT